MATILDTVLYDVIQVITLGTEIGPITENPPRIQRDEVLVGVIEGPIRAVAQDFTRNPGAYDPHYQLHKRNFVKVTLYGVPRNEIEKHRTWDHTSLIKLGEFLKTRGKT